MAGPIGPGEDETSAPASEIDPEPFGLRSLSSLADLPDRWELVPSVWPAAWYLELIGDSRYVALCARLNVDDPQSYSGFQRVLNLLLGDQPEFKAPAKRGPKGNKWNLWRYLALWADVECIKIEQRHRNISRACVYIQSNSKRPAQLYFERWNGDTADNLRRRYADVAKKMNLFNESHQQLARMTWAAKPSVDQL